jgi:hypothetical protein
MQPERWSDMIAAEERLPGPYSATIYARDGLRFRTAANTTAALKREVARYISQRAESQLWEPDAAEVSRLLNIGAVNAAIEQYFDSVGKRWDDEWIILRSVR